MRCQHLSISQPLTVWRSLSCPALGEVSWAVSYLEMTYWVWNWTSHLNSHWAAFVSMYSMLCFNRVKWMGSVKEAFVLVLDAKANIRDYHGKMAVHYWTGSTDVFNKPGSQSGEATCNFRMLPCLRINVEIINFVKWLLQLRVSISETDACFICSGGKWSRGRRGQRYAQFSSLLMSRSRSHGHLNMEQDSQPLPLSRGRSPSWRLVPSADAPQSRGPRQTLHLHLWSSDT